MSFREKSAWISFLTVLLAAGAVVGIVASMGPYSGSTLHLGLMCLIALVVLQIVLRAVAAAASRAGERGPRDEREHAIVLRSHQVGYYVLVAAVLAMFVTGHMTRTPIDLIYHAFAAVTLSTLAISLAQIVMFRLGR